MAANGGTANDEGAANTGGWIGNVALHFLNKLFGMGGERAPARLPGETLGAYLARNSDISQGLFSPESVAGRKAGQPQPIVPSANEPYRGPPLAIGGTHVEPSRRPAGKKAKAKKAKGKKAKGNPDNPFGLPDWLIDSAEAITQVIAERPASGKGWVARRPTDQEIRRANIMSRNPGRQRGFVSLTGKAPPPAYAKAPAKPPEAPRKPPGGRGRPPPRKPPPAASGPWKGSTDQELYDEYRKRYGRAPGPDFLGVKAGLDPKPKAGPKAKPRAAPEPVKPKSQADWTPEGPIDPTAPLGSDSNPGPVKPRNAAEERKVLEELRRTLPRMPDDFEPSPAEEDAIDARTQPNGDPTARSRQPGPRTSSPSATRSPGPTRPAQKIGRIILPTVRESLTSTVLRALTQRSPRVRAAGNSAARAVPRQIIGVVTPNTAPTAPIPLEQPFLTGIKTKSDVCECEKRKKRKPRAPRTECRAGTYRQTAKGVKYSPERIVPCN